MDGLPQQAGVLRCPPSILRSRHASLASSRAAGRGAHRVNGPVLIGKATFRLTSHKIPIARANLWRAIRIGFSLYRVRGHALRFRALILVAIVLMVGFPPASFPWLVHRLGHLRA